MHSKTEQETERKKNRKRNKIDGVDIKKKREIDNVIHDCEKL